MAIPIVCETQPFRSSFGVGRIETPEEFSAAFKEAQKECTEVVVEEGISGVEVGCGVLRANYDFASNRELDESATQSIAITEIVPTESTFFDYEAKYDGKSQEITRLEYLLKLLLSLSKSPFERTMYSV